MIKYFQISNNFVSDGWTKSVLENVIKFYMYFYFIFLFYIEWKYFKINRTKARHHTFKNVQIYRENVSIIQNVFKHFCDRNCKFFFQAKNILKFESLPAKKNERTFELNFRFKKILQKFCKYAFSLKAHQYVA